MSTNLHRSTAEVPYFAYGNHEAALKEIHFAYRSVPYFKQQALRTGGLPSSVRNTPMTDKSVYRTNFPEGILVEKCSVNDPYVSRLQSSGTSGDRLVSVVHAFKLADRMANCLALNPALGFLLDVPKIRTCRYAAPNCSDVECANPNTQMHDRILPDGTLVLPVFHDLLTTPQPMLQSAFRELHSYEPHIWYVDPMHLSFLIKNAAANSWEFDLDRKFAVLLTYTFATKALLRQLKQFLGDRAPIASVLAMSEFGYVGLECSHGNLHLNDKDFYLEFFRLEGAPNDQNLYELAISSIGDRLCPHIRYKTNDVYELGHTCSCGSSMPVVKFQGRNKDLLRLKDGRVVTPSALDDTVGAPLWIDIFQLTFQQPDSFIFRYAGNPDLLDAGERNALKERLEQLLGTRNVRIEYVKYFPFERGGKFQLIRSQ